MSGGTGLYLLFLGCITIPALAAGWRWGRTASETAAIALLAFLTGIYGLLIFAGVTGLLGRTSYLVLAGLFLLTTPVLLFWRRPHAAWFRHARLSVSVWELALIAIAAVPLGLRMHAFWPRYRDVHPLYSVDVLTDEIPAVLNFVAQGHLWHIPSGVTASYPYANQLVVSSPIVIMETDALFGFMHLGIVLCAFAFMGLCFRQILHPTIPAGLVVAVLLAALAVYTRFPIYEIVFTAIGKNDAPTVLFAFAALYFGLRATTTGERRDFLCQGIAIGFFVGVKPTALAYMVAFALFHVVVLLFANHSPRQWRTAIAMEWRVVLDRLLCLAIPTALLGIWWYVRNLATYGDFAEPLVAEVTEGRAIWRNILTSEIYNWGWGQRLMAASLAATPLAAWWVVRGKGDGPLRRRRAYAAFIFITSVVTYIFTPSGAFPHDPTPGVHLDVRLSGAMVPLLVLGTAAHLLSAAWPALRKLDLADRGIHLTERSIRPLAGIAVILALGGSAGAIAWQADRYVQPYGLVSFEQAGGEPTGVYVWAAAQSGRSFFTIELVQWGFLGHDFSNRVHWPYLDDRVHTAAGLERALQRAGNPDFVAVGRPVDPATGALGPMPEADAILAADPRFLEVYRDSRARVYWRQRGCLVGVGEGWYPSERDGGDTWRWSAGTAELRIASETAGTIDLRLNVQSAIAGNALTIRDTNGFRTTIEPATDRFAPIAVTIPVQAGETRIVLESAQAGRGTSADPRELAFRAGNLTARGPTGACVISP